MLTRKQLKQLRNEIVLNSLYTDDYENSLFIKSENVYSFFEGYMNYLYELALEKNKKINDDNYYDVVFKLDNLNNLYNYYCMYEDDPLIQDDITGSKAINNSDSIVIYDYDDEYIKVAYLYIDGLYMRNTKIKTLKLYYGIKKDDYYFILKKRRYYLNEFMRVDY